MNNKFYIKIPVISKIGMPSTILRRVDKNKNFKKYLPTQEQVEEHIRQNIIRISQKLKAIPLDGTLSETDFDEMIACLAKDGMISIPVNLRKIEIVKSSIDDPVIIINKFVQIKKEKFPMEEKLGIELLKKLVVESIDVFYVVKDKLSDGFQWTDVLPIAMEAKDLNFVITKWGEVGAQFKDMDTAEFESLVGLAVDELGFENEPLKNFIIKLAIFASSGYEVFEAYKALKPAENQAEETE